MQLQNWASLPDSYAVVHDYELASALQARLPKLQNLRLQRALFIGHFCWIEDRRVEGTAENREQIAFCVEHRWHAQARISQVARIDGGIVGVAP